MECETVVMDDNSFEIGKSAGKQTAKQNTNVTLRKSLKFKSFASIERFGHCQQKSAVKKRHKDLAKSSQQKKRNILRRIKKWKIMEREVNSCTILYRIGFNTVLFDVQSIYRLIAKLLPLINMTDLTTGNVFIKDKAIKGGFVAWKHLRDRINLYLHNKCLRDFLNRYDPLVSNHSTKSEQEGCLKNHIKVFGMDVAFALTRGQIFFDILGVFSLLGELSIPMGNKWELIDMILHENGMSHRDAFRRHHKWSWTQRSHISLGALILLIENGLVQCPARREVLLRLFKHIRGETALISQRKSQLVEALEKIVQDTPITEKPANGVKTEKAAVKMETMEEDVNTNEDHENTFEKAQKRHTLFSKDCCEKKHQISLADRPVSYIIHNGSIFLNKEEAFASIERSYLTTRSDYRQCDKILSEAGHLVSEHFLYSNIDGHKANSNSKLKRTHISLEAMSLLVERNFSFIDVKEKVKTDIELLMANIGKYASVCNGMTKPDSDIPNLTQETFDPSRASSSKSENEEEEIIPLEEKANDKPAEKKNEVITLSKAVNGKEISGISLDGNAYLNVKDLKHAFECSEPEGETIENLIEKTDISDSDLRIHCDNQFISADFLQKMFQLGQLRYANDDTKGIIEEWVEVDTSKDENLSKNAKKPQKVRNRSEKAAALERKAIFLKSMNFSDPTVSVLGELIPFKVSNNVLYLSLVNIVPEDMLKKINKVIEAGGVSIDKAFLFANKRRSYISIAALLILIEEKIIGSSGKRKRLKRRLRQLNKERSDLKSIHVRAVPNFGNMMFRVQETPNGSALYIHLLQFLKSAGLALNHITDSRHRIICNLLKVLRLRGVKPKSSFLSQGYRKYEFISMEAALVLLQTNFGPFRDKTLMAQLRTCLLESMKIFSPTSFEVPELTNENSFPLIDDISVRIPFKEAKTYLFVHRQTCFELVGLENVIMVCNRGFLPIIQILQERRIDVEAAFIGSEKDEHDFMSLSSFLALMNAKDPLINCLEKDKFMDSLLLTIQSNIIENLDDSCTIDIPKVGSIPVRVEKGRLYLSRNEVFALSGLDKKFEMSAHVIGLLRDQAKCEMDYFLNEDTDPYAFLSIDALLFLFSYDLERDQDDNDEVLWKNAIDFVFSEVPKLKNRLKTIMFYEGFINQIAALFHQALRGLQTSSSDKHENVKIRKSLDSTNEHQTKRMRLAENQSISEDICLDEIMPVEENIDQSLFQPEISRKTRTSSSSSVNSLPSDESECLPEFSIDEFNKLKEELSKRGQEQKMGDWKIFNMDEDTIHLILPQGSNSSRKHSFINPDDTGVFKFEIIFKCNMTIQILVNGLRIGSKETSRLLEKSSEESLLSLLCSLLMLRPCFGSFCPELVETVERGVQNQDDETWNKVFVDKNFIAQGANGRTYAGTVRSKSCKILAKSEVEDVCVNCNPLRRMVVNRSVLPTANDQPEDGGGLQGVNKQLHQKSVWQIAETSVDGCTFVCPQWQSFNASLPHHFSSVNQATAIVEHKVQISQDLKFAVSLNGHGINVITFEDFERNKQVGPLLEWVAKLRFCIGYPDPEFVRQTQYLLENRAVFKNSQSFETQRRMCFKNLEVDTSFSWLPTESNPLRRTLKEVKGCVRSRTCTFVAGDHGDICDECMMLQVVNDGGVSRRTF